MNFFHWSHTSDAVRRHVFGTALGLVGGLCLQLGLSTGATAQTAPYPNKSITMKVGIMLMKEGTSMVPNTTAKMRFLNRKFIKAKA